MRITVFGATGAVGGQVVRRALAAGDKVTAVVRDPARFALAHPALDVVTARDLSDPDPLRPALDGVDAVISAIGPRGRKDGPVASTATRGILLALADTGVRRFVALSAAPAGPVPADDSWLNRRILLPFVGALLRDTYVDLAAMEDDIRRSGAEWTVLRPPKFTNGATTGRYRTRIGGAVPRGYTISRGDVAHALLAVLGDPATIRQPVGIAY